MFKHAFSRQVLVVDDEPDIFSLTQLALKDLTLMEQPLELAYAASAAEAQLFLRDNPHTAVILLDVVMESDTAGLELCQWIREHEGNSRVRIVLRTGQPGVAPERKVIDQFEIDGYLAKAEMTKMRLYTAVKTGLKTYSELTRAALLEQTLTYLHEVVLELASSTSLPELLQQVVETAVVVSDAPLALLYLQTPDQESPYLLYSGDQEEIVDLGSRIDEVIWGLNQEQVTLEGTIVPVPLRNGDGWFYLDQPLQHDPVARHVLPILAAHVAHIFERSQLPVPSLS